MAVLSLAKTDGEWPKRRVGETEGVCDSGTQTYHTKLTGVDRNRRWQQKTAKNDENNGGGDGIGEKRHRP